MKIATRDDWNIKEMPEKRDTFTLERAFTEEQIVALRRGNIPQEMEDKWFWYMESHQWRQSRCPLALQNRRKRTRTSVI